MRRPERLWIWVAFILASYVLFDRVQGRCEGDSCPEQSRDAKAAGLLGGAVIQQCSHTKDYPSDGTKLKPVSASLCMTCEPLNNIRRSYSYRIKCFAQLVDAFLHTACLSSCFFLPQIDFEAPVVDLRWAGVNHDVDKVSLLYRCKS